jgi:6-phosphofructokinase 2
MLKIITLTMNPSVDVSTSVDRVVPEDKLRCQQASYDAGGGGINVARVIRRLGGEARAIYTSGGATGRMLQRMLDEEELDHTPVQIRERTRQNFTAADDTTGEEFRFVLPGPTLTKAEWRACMDALFAVEEPPGYVVLSGSLPPGVPDDFYAEIARRGRERQMRIVVDAVGEPLRAALDRGVYLVKPNVQELSALTGRELAERSEQELSALEIVERGQSEIVVLSFGGEGAMVASREGCEWFYPPEIETQSATAAGDSMVALIVLSLARGASLLDAMRRGIAAGAATAAKPGTELCDPEDVKHLTEQVVEET